LELFKIFEIKLDIDIFGVFLISQETYEGFESSNDIVSGFLKIGFKSGVDDVNKFLSDVFLSKSISFLSLFTSIFSFFLCLWFLSLSSGKFACSLCNFLFMDSGGLVCVNSGFGPLEKQNYILMLLLFVGLLEHCRYAGWGYQPISWQLVDVEPLHNKTNEKSKSIPLLNSSSTCSKSSDLGANLVKTEEEHFQLIYCQS
jgi:hypothetical protein